MEEKPNHSYINQLSAGDKDFEEQLLDIVRIEFPQEIAQYKSYLQSGNLQDAGNVVHKIKHKISILGLEKSYHVAIAYEEKLKQSIVDENLYLQFGEILDAMTTFLKKPKN